MVHVCGGKCVVCYACDVKCMDVLCVWRKCEQVVCRVCVCVLCVSCWWCEEHGCVLCVFVVQAWIHFLLCVLCTYVCARHFSVASSSQGNQSVSVCLGLA